ncbi:MAG: tyrosine-type recombinase/integrase [Gemmataceae bacterium]|nr:tyrosine-type recombinase/integrase [Gemmataceae bacterium]
MAALQERNGWFHLIFRYQGRQYSQALKTQDRREAEALRGVADRVLIRIRNHEIPPPPPDADLPVFLLAGGKVPEPAKPVEAPLTLQDLSVRYEAAHSNGAMEKNSLATARMHLNHFVAALGERFVLREMTAQDLQGYLDRRARKKGAGRGRLSPTTLRKEVASLRAAWNWASRTGILAGVFPGRGLTYPKADEKPPFQTREEIERKIRRGGLSEAEVDELWDSLFLTKPEVAEFLAFARANAFQPFLYPMVAFAAHTGARRSELLRVLIDDVDLEGRTALIREKKRVRGKRSTRRVPLSGPLCVVLKEWLAAHPGGQYLFCQQPEVFRSKKRSRTTGHLGDRTRPTSLKGRVAGVTARTERPGLGPLTKDEAHDHFQRLIRGSKWEVVKGWHVLRHSLISVCAADGVDQRMLQQWVGHLSEETHLIPSREQQAIAGVFG